MNTKEVANKLVGYCRQGQFEDAMKELYGQNIESYEPKGSKMDTCIGLEAVIKKGEMFQDSVETFHGMEVSDPVVAENFFSCSMAMDITFKGGPRTTMEEVCMYKVEEGKITREEFFYTLPPEE